MINNSIPRSLPLEKLEEAPEGTLYCHACMAYKSTGDFYSYNAARCKACIAERNRQRYDRAHPKTSRVRYPTPVEDAPPGMAFCRKCRACKNRSDFYLKRNGIETFCKECREDIRRLRNASTKRKPAGRTKHQNRISSAHYDEMYSNQGGVCAICGKSQNLLPEGKTRRLIVDHDHVTGKIRGLLCMRCNFALGFFMDSAENLSSAIDYLMGFNS